MNSVEDALASIIKTSSKCLARLTSLYVHYLYNNKHTQFTNSFFKIVNNIRKQCVSSLKHQINLTMFKVIIRIQWKR